MTRLVSHSVSLSACSAVSGLKLAIFADATSKRGDELDFVERGAVKF